MEIGAGTSEITQETLDLLLYNYFLNFNNKDVAADALSSALFFANQAILTQTVDATYGSTARTIYTSPGVAIQKPTMTLAAMILVYTSDLTPALVVGNRHRRVALDYEYHLLNQLSE